MYTTQEVSALYSVTIETARTWAKEFGRYLSPTANPGPNKTRNFSLEDMQVFSLVRQLRNEGRTMEEIHAALQNGERGPMPDLESGDVRAIVSQETEKRMAMQVSILEERIFRLQEQVNDLTPKAIRAAELELELVRAKAEIEFLKQRLELEREMGEMRGELKALRDKKED